MVTHTLAVQSLFGTLLRLLPSYEYGILGETVNVSILRRQRNRPVLTFSSTSRRIGTQGHATRYHIMENHAKQPDFVLLPDYCMKSPSTTTTNDLSLLYGVALELSEEFVPFLVAM